MSRLSSLALLVHPVFYSNNLYIVEMESAKQRIRAAAARQKAEKKAQEAGGRRRQPLRSLPGRQRGSLTGVIAAQLKRLPSLPVP